MSAPETPRPRFGSLADLTSSRFTRVVIESKTKIIRGLFALAPKRRRSKVRWVVAAGLLAVIGTLALDVSVREYAQGHALAFYRAHAAAPAPIIARAPAAPAAEATSVTQATSVSWPVTDRAAADAATTTTTPSTATPTVTNPPPSPRIAKPRIRRTTSLRAKG